MVGKNRPELRLVREPEIDQERKKAHMNRRKLIEKISIIVSVLLIILLVIYMFLSGITFTKTLTTVRYEEKTSDSNRYVQFENGIVRYNRDGVVFLNKHNKEQWIHPCQIKQPIIDVNDKCFAVADCVGNSILVFTKDGIKGEIKTTLPIEKISVSDQGIVGVILKNENSPSIILYDATGNILVEHKISLGRIGYPIALEISPDGTKLAVCHIMVDNGVKKSKVIFYDYGKTGENKADNVVREDTYEGVIIPEIFFMNGGTALAVSDSSIIVYDTKGEPSMKKEVKIDREIKNVVHTKNHVALILLNSTKSGYEARVYNKEGNEVTKSEFIGEYSNIKIAGKELIMTSGKNCLIIRRNGTIKFQGEMSDNILEIVPALGPNRYLVMTKNELSSVFLIK